MLTFYINFDITKSHRMIYMVKYALELVLQARME